MQVLTNQRMVPVYNTQGDLKSSETSTSIMQIFSFPIPLGISPCTCRVDPFSYYFSFQEEILIQMSQNKEALTIEIDTHRGQ